MTTPKKMSLVVAAVAALLVGCGDGDGEGSGAGGPLSDEEGQAIVQMREQEKLERDADGRPRAQRGSTSAQKTPRS